MGDAMHPRLEFQQIWLFVAADECVYQLDRMLTGNVVASPITSANAKWTFRFLEPPLLNRNRPLPNRHNES
ncbi:unnamed protein product [Mesocestoides corti]|uniref:Transposase n=1 Tax=Mesocestoides corti TaxID=53468 RepID=A0A0R3U6X6_MESCO|nr:unnamed protein product [Mesocestoides corti]